MSRRFKQVGGWVVLVKFTKGRYEKKDGKEGIDGYVPPYWFTYYPSGQKTARGSVYCHIFNKDMSEPPADGEYVFEMTLTERTVADKYSPGDLMYYSISLKPTEKAPEFRVLVGEVLPIDVCTSGEVHIFSGPDDKGDAKGAHVALIPLTSYADMMYKMFGGDGVAK